VSQLSSPEADDLAGERRTAAGGRISQIEPTEPAARWIRSSRPTVRTTRPTIGAVSICASRS
jgi:hypothetical protein